MQDDLFQFGLVDSSRIYSYARKEPTYRLPETEKNRDTLLIQRL